MLQKVDLLIYI